MNTLFESELATSMEAMIKYKESLGYSRVTYEPYLRMIDKFCFEHYPQETRLTKELVLKWSQLHPREQANGFRRRMIAIRELGKYLNTIGIEAYIYPSEFLSKTQRFEPYIFTDCELKAFFNAADIFSRSKNAQYNHYVVPVIYRLIYTCGLRPGEVRNIKCTDVNLVTGRIYIRESKAYKDRIVIMSKDMLLLCNKYEEIIKSVLINREYFFTNSKGTIISKQSLIDHFKKCCANTGIIGFCGSRKPRVYDLRHNYATRKFMKWLDEGRDLCAVLPYLSKYMGHYDFSQTSYYIHLLPERLIHSKAIDWKRFSDLIPEVQM
ncbi:tyrosine-type recombinase/integrase [Clostridium sp. FP2]|uniref:tyrosine-type recombinase/integrase n=1 Tax=Clostridium sp. FP2 TaxID=2724481 RepID=UPI001CCEFF53|nr:tyrosine-type recombinase/integrase [Clostridium sp. FP2]MBZ9623680.1 tyrosine-type recombinase/integrase [Clostridium sp. FP2]MBZ9623688.1 tyrosine-type recombinase/integrase [Clostridium sp. FP2]MBZ9624401.1 tyrosine-type recombinase/integrase [Clostridium sp. FP2]